jgi:hypothetical protein
MVAAMNAYSREEPWPELDNEAFRRRRSDRHLQRTVLAETGIKYSPMSPASSASAVTVCRLAQLREDGYRISGRRFDRAGADRVLEVSCPAALIIWGFEHKGYKSGGRTADERPEAAAARASSYGEPFVKRPGLIGPSKEPSRQRQATLSGRHERAPGTPSASSASYARAGYLMTADSSRGLQS